MISTVVHAVTVTTSGRQLLVDGGDLLLDDWPHILGRWRIELEQAGESLARKGQIAPA